MSQTIEAGSGNIKGQSDAESLFIGGTVTQFRGKTRFYTIETYYNGNRTAFTEMSEYFGLVNLVTALYLEIYPNRDKDLAEARMEQGLSHPRTRLDLLLHEGNPVGYGISSRFFIDGEPVVYISRAIQEKHGGENAGTYFVNSAVQWHQEESMRSHRQLHWLALMTQNPLSVLTLEKSPYIDRIFPFGERYNSKRNREAQSLMLGVHQKVYMFSRGINTSTGVSKGELRELGMNENFRPSREHPRALAIYQEMISPEGLDMNREAGDEVYVLARIKRPDPVDAVAMTFIQAAA